MKARNALRALLTVAAVSLAVAPSAQAAQPVHVRCGETITKDTKLANDLTNCPGIGIGIGADEITLDLNGHTVDGDGIGDFEGVQNVGHNGVTIRGGSIREFVEGVAVLSARDNTVRDLSLSEHRHVGVFVGDSAAIRVLRTSSREVASSGIFVTRSHDVQIDRNHVSDSGGGIAARVSDHLRITRNNTSRNENEGLLIFDEAEHVQVERNSVSGNASAGIVVAANENALSRNLVSGNGDNIVIAGDRNTVSRNEVADALGFPDDPVGGFGILIDGGDDNALHENHIRGAASNGIRVIAFDPESSGPAEANVLRGNRIERSRLDDLLIDDTAVGSLLERNLAERAGDDGIDVESVATTLTKNTANHNHDLGIEAVLGVTDGGGNKASGNGNPLQCTNVFCK